MKIDYFLVGQFLGRHLALTGKPADPEDVEILAANPGWIHVIQRNPQDRDQTRTGFVDSGKFYQDLPRMIEMKWPA